MIERASRGELPGWAEISPSRYDHVARVAAVMDDWARSWGLDRTQCARWRAAGWLHDVLRDAPGEHLRPWVGPPFVDLPDSFLHGPAGAARLAHDGLDDEELLDAIRYHTLGNPDLDRLGLSLIAADYLEPGRSRDAEWRATLRVRARTDFDPVIRAVVRSKLDRCVQGGVPVRREMEALWDRLVRDEAQGRS